MMDGETWPMSQAIPSTGMKSSMEEDKLWVAGEREAGFQTVINKQLFLLSENRQDFSLHCLQSTDFEGTHNCQLLQI